MHIAENEGVCAAVISCCDAAPVFEFTEHVLDFVALLVESFIVCDLYLSVLLGRDAGLDAFAFQSLSEPIGIVAAIRQKVLGQRQIIDDQARELEEYCDEVVQSGGALSPDVLAKIQEMLDACKRVAAETPE